MQWAQKQKGFTIVELLIVVVVIAILAAITIVAFNGIQNRAKAGAAQSTASQAAKKISSVAVLNSDLYPVAADFSSATGLRNAGNVTYQYSVGSDQKSFCITATTDNISYFVSNQKLAPTLGACPGHGLNGGTAITNLITNPSFETGAGGWTRSGNITAAHSATGGLYGNGYYSGQRTSTAAIGFYSPQFAVEAGETYTIRLNARYNAGQVANLRYQWYDAGGAVLSSNSSGTTPSTNAATWQTLSFTFTAPANAVNARLDIILGTAGAAVGDPIDIDGAMAVKTSTVYGYADGNTAGWVWNDVANPNMSTSTGPPQ